MIPRIFALISAILVSVPLINTAAALISTPDSTLVFLGLSALLSIAVGWTYIARYYIRYFSRKDVQDEIASFFDLDSGR